MACCSYFKAPKVVQCRCFGFFNWPFWLGHFLGYFLKNWANYFSNLLVTLEEEKAERKKIKNALRGFPQMFNNDECFFTQKDRAYKCTFI
jgi:hypothetical protein